MTAIEPEGAESAREPSWRQDKFDLLVQPFASTDGVWRVNDGIEATKPWSFARFDAVQLRRGWWRLECAGDIDGLDVRLASTGQPLIVIPGDDAAGRIVHLGVDDAFDISLCMSPWPGYYRISVLRLVRLGAVEQMKTLLSAARFAWSRGNFIRRTIDVASRVLRGEAVGIRVRAHIHAQASSVKVIDTPESMQIEQHGEVVGLRYPNDQMHPSSFEIVEAEFARDPTLMAVLADAIEGGEIHPRPSWDREFLNRTNGAELPLFFRRSAYLANGSRQASLAAIVSNYGEGAVARVALPLVSRVDRLRPSVATVPAPALGRYPRVSALIPTKTRVDLLAQCLEGLSRRTDYPDLEVVIIDNGHVGPAFAELLARASKALDVRTIRDDRAFNFSRLINFGAAHATGEVLLSFNDDVDPIDPTWLRRMVASAVAPEIGAVGARLLYPDQTLQHAGIVTGIGGSCGHLWKGLAPHEAALIPQAVLPSERQSVTGACLAVARTKFDRVGGFDAEAFPIGFSDVDFCLRLREQGLRNIYRGDAILLHKESQSRQAEPVSSERRQRDIQDNARFRKRWRDVVRAPDPFGSPAYDIESETGRVHRALSWKPKD